jgi:hypothetical protein
MTQYRIYLDDKPFSGVDLDGDWPVTPPGFRAGWHHLPGNGHTRDVLTFGGEPHIIWDRRTLTGYVNDIIEALRDGLLAGSRLVIEIEEVTR